ncbi:hypothetical protein [Sporomusa acidovorans]|uniref:Uncharacterized protein n=1 Tax=Sporomusa acidovorans (strain ATCC 49682 / DSM 3132 / Mol) TaxID=1123286 RepID=A0ABZ3J090_SPOA4|nr:hypothetical protein [Sporomusa acidovorans]OZC21966.1 hypothetical protein SPACI_16490 [Sporomusa acidovorans DSM 3132]SDF65285.1 hypothetical protein SAMN04488499_106529 [Sporomusa acidovorans]
MAAADIKAKSCLPNKTKSSTSPTSGTSLLQLFIKEIKALAKSYVDYAKNIEL